MRGVRGGGDGVVDGDGGDGWVVPPWLWWSLVSGIDREGFQRTEIRRVD